MLLKSQPKKSFSTIANLLNILLSSFVIYLITTWRLASAINLNNVAQST